MRILNSRILIVLTLTTLAILLVVSTWLNETVVIQYSEKECDCGNKNGPSATHGVPVLRNPNQTMLTEQTLQSSNLSTKKTWSEIAEEYHTYVNTVQVKCNNIVRMGKADDGGWDICDDEQYRPKQPCLIYSFGINNDWSFDDAVSKKYGCHVHAFDPSMKQDDHNRSDLIHFHKLGLAEREYTNPQGWRLNTLAGIRKQLGHSQTEIQIIKMDTDKAELTSLPEMVTSGALKDVSQFVFEIHIRVSQSFETEADLAKYEMGLRLLKQVYDEGFRIFKSHQNPWSKYPSRFGPVRYGCHELHMVRVK
ncbi:methyltransferase-like protein 24 [Gigantopelta aegis]|uniref:methyltransferase-like protein 24 n=1 Tax=Gigantopelta aegis TaxID=1735272 RepID=UPI001B88C77E|nr:methyltransferase-like protein 24 [Gigantopelta aegis]